MKLKRKSKNDLELGNVVYSDYTRKYYIVSSLPRITDNSIADKIALVRLDGCGYFYLSGTLKELINKMNTDGGETTAFEVLEYNIIGNEDDLDNVQ